MRSFSWLLLVAAMAWSSVAFAVEGTVRLKNGGFIQGDVLEHLPGERVSVRTSDGSVRNIPWDEVERVEEGPAPEPTPPPTETPSPAPPAERDPVYSAPPEPSPAIVLEDDASARFNALTLTLFGTLGFLGQVSLDGEATITNGNDIMMVSIESQDSDLTVSYGGGAQLDVPLHRHFSMGGLVRLSSWAPEDADGRALFADFLATPRLRFPFALSPGSVGVVYVQVPIGAAYVDLPEDGNATLSPAFVVGFGGGFMALLSEHLGVSLELGWLHRAFSAESKSTVATATGTFDIDAENDVAVAQPYFQLGVVLAF